MEVIAIFHAWNGAQLVTSTTFSTTTPRYWWYSAQRTTSHIVARDLSAASGGKLSPNRSGCASRLRPWAWEWLVQLGEAHSNSVVGK